MADNVRVYKEYLRLHLKSAMEYRMSFLAQSTFMFLNNGFWLIMFYYLFKELGTINGYTATDAMLLFGIGALAFGFVFVFFGNVNRTWESVADGNFDFFLTKPVDELFHNLMGRMSYSGMGDLLFGITLLIVFVPDKIVLAFTASILGAIVFLSFEIMIDSLCFFVERPKNLTRTLHHFFTSLTIWPIDTFNIYARFALYAVMIAFMTTVPRNVIQSDSWSHLLILAVVAVAMLTLSIIIFKYGVRKYESGNMMTTRG